MARNCGCGRRVYREDDFMVKTSCPEITLEFIKKDHRCFQVNGIVTCNTVPLRAVNVNLSSSPESIVQPESVSTDPVGAFSFEVNLLENASKEVEVTATVIANKAPVTTSIVINV
ncbi:hypothetical protein [Bacillus sp. 179-C3.3 HS]|uniref:hypothetical protein n=1 Tax=Bacillus sp. 179-C3.3 HS TaxID=3232162 RepID=UPI0039A087D4